VRAGSERQYSWNRVRGLTRDDEVEGHDAALDVVENGKNVARAAGHDAKPNFVVDLRGADVGLRQELGVERIPVLSTTDELEYWEVVGQGGRHDAVDLLLDPLAHFLVCSRQHEQELARFEVVDDVHHLQDRTGADLPMALRRCEHQQSDQVLLRHRLWDGEIEVTAQVVDRGFLDLCHARHVALVVRVDLLGSHERLGLAFVGEVEPVPVDHRSSAQQNTNALEVGQGEIGETAELRHRHG